MVTLINEQELQEFKTVYKNAVSALDAICDDVYARLDQDCRTYSPEATSVGPVGLGYVIHILDPNRRIGQFRLQAEALKAARSLVEGEKFESLTKRETWEALWKEEIFQTHFKKMVGDRAAARESGNDERVRLFTSAGYVFWSDGETFTPADQDAQLECLMEFLAAIWCGLLFLGIRADSLWNRILQLAADDTSGLPFGVCVYKAYGDIYRQTLRELATLETCEKTKGDIIDAQNARVRQLIMNPCIFGSIDIGESEDSVPTDISLPMFRRIGALYYVIYQIAYLRSGRSFTLVWLFRNADDFKVRFGGNNEAKMWVRYAYGRAAYSPDNLVGSGRRKHAFWACSRQAFTQPPCVMGLRYGVVTVDASPGSRKAGQKESDPFLVSTVPFGARRVAHTMFESLSLVIAHIAEQIKTGLQGAEKGELTIDGDRYEVHDLLVQCFSPDAQTRVNPTSS